MKKKKTI